MAATDLQGIRRYFAVSPPVGAKRGSGLSVGPPEGRSIKIAGP